jgi:formamidopyrimidine-DNA glycosylase
VPELPEVEVTRRRIAPLVLGRTIVRVDATGARPVFLTRPARLRAKLLGRRIDAVERLGKYLLLRLDDGGVFCVHLGMTGQLVTAEAFAGSRAAADRHVHLTVGFAGGGPVLFLRDPRQFGRVFGLGQAETSPRLERLGPDALSIGEADFSARVRARRAAIKAVLLDQKLLAGVGNIYADEALFAASLRPTRRANRLSRGDCHRLYQALQSLLRRAIAAGGTTVSDFIHPDGSEGAFGSQCRVYGREGQPCCRCGTPIRRQLVAQRSAHSCPRCQR